MARLPADQKVARDAEIAAARASGLTWATIAARFDLTERQCRSIVRSLRAADPLFDDHDALDTVRETLEMLDALVEKFAMVAATAKHDAVQLGALKGQLAAVVRLFELEQAVGLVPFDLRLLKRQLEVDEMIEVVVDVLHRHDPSGAAADDLLRALHEPITSRNGASAAA